MYEIPWKKIPDDLPDPEVDVLVTDGDLVWRAWLAKDHSDDTDDKTLYGTVFGDWFDADGGYCSVPTHWAPMPELP